MKQTMLAIMLFLSLSAKAQKDSMTYIRKDNYPITNDMLRKGDKRLVSLGVESFDKVWFRKNNGSEILIINLATDLYRAGIYHLDVSDLPDDAWQYIFLSDTADNRANTAQINKALSGFIKQATKVDSSCLASKKGIRLGTTTAKYAINLYGKPDSIIRASVDKYVWRFEGDIVPNMRNYKKRILVKDSFGYTVVMYFKEDKLIAHILIDDIP